MHNLKVRKVYGITCQWLLINEEDFKDFQKCVQEAEMGEGPKPPKEFPCMAWFLDVGVPEVGPCISGIYLYQFEAAELIKESGGTIRYKDQGGSIENW